MAPCNGRRGRSVCNFASVWKQSSREKMVDKPEMDNLRIVVVEDEAFIRLDLITHLQAGGHQVVGTADCAADAVHVVEQKRPYMVLMDVRLIGERDGIHAATEIWQRFAIRCLLVSANLDAGARARAAGANPIGFLEKPFNKNSLLAAVGAARS
jgi:DNA-binding NarL/FixJ family response regulator